MPPCCTDFVGPSILREDTVSLVLVLYQYTLQYLTLNFRKQIFILARAFWRFFWCEVNKIYMRCVPLGQNFPRMFPWGKLATELRNNLVDEFPSEVILAKTFHREDTPTRNLALQKVFPAKRILSEGFPFRALWFPAPQISLETQQNSGQRSLGSVRYI